MYNAFSLTSQNKSLTPKILAWPPSSFMHRISRKACLASDAWPDMGFILLMATFFFVSESVALTTTPYEPLPMTLKPPYLGLTLNEVPPTETLTSPRVVILYWCSGCPGQRSAAADLCRASRGLDDGARGAGQLRWRVLPSRRPAGQFLSHQLNPTSSVLARHGSSRPSRGSFPRTNA